MWLAPNVRSVVPIHLDYAGLNLAAEKDSNLRNTRVRAARLKPLGYPPTSSYASHFYRRMCLSDYCN
jgi:hypothetical protein